MAIQHFSPAVADKLECYVYRLIDPRNGATFYIGRGRGNRVFSHASGNERPSNGEDTESLKLKIIREIIADGFQVEHVIHRHGLTEQVAIEVEAALIDAYPGLANIQAGYASERGVMHASQILRLYEAEEAKFKHNVILITINRSLEDRSIRDAVRFAWKIAKSKAEQAEFVLAVRNGMIVGVFTAANWRAATPENFPGFPLTDRTRFGFDVEEASEEIKRNYFNKRVLPQKRGAANPIRYEGPWRIHK